MKNGVAAVRSGVAGGSTTGMNRKDGVALIRAWCGGPLPKIPTEQDRERCVVLFSDGFLNIPLGCTIIPAIRNVTRPELGQSEAREEVTWILRKANDPATDVEIVGPFAVNLEEERELAVCAPARCSMVDELTAVPGDGYSRLTWSSRWREPAGHFHWFFLDQNYETGYCSRELPQEEQARQDAKAAMREIEP